MANAAAVFAIRDWLFVCATPTSEDGISVVGAITTMARDAVPDVVGIAVLDALAASTQVAPAATEHSWQASYQPMLAITGLENVRELMLAAALVVAEEEGGTLTLTLAEKPPKGNVRAFSTLDAKTPHGSQEIGNAVCELLDARVF